MYPDLTLLLFYRCQEYGALCEYSPNSKLHNVQKPFQRSTSQLVSIQSRLLQPHTSSPSLSLAQNESERRYFDLFHEELAFDLSGRFNTPFWSRLVPQYCHHEPAIKHAVFALCALYKSTLSSRTHTVKLDEHFKFALLHQRQAINSLRIALSDEHPQLRLALVASLLFGCFESFHGNWETATQQIYSGLSILKQLKSNKTMEEGATLANTEDLEIGLTLDRLKLQILSFLAVNPMCEHPSIDPEDDKFFGDIPNHFATLNEAFFVATNMAILILRHSRSSARLRGMKGAQESMAREQQYLTRLVDKWNLAYQHLFANACQNTSDRDSLGVLQLRICIWKCEIMIATSLSDTETIFDNYTSQFRDITHFARHVLEHDQLIRQFVGPRVQYGMGLIMALFYTATRCRDSSIRIEAIAVLREWPSINGIWHSLQAAKVAEWIIEIEEKSCQGHSYIHEKHRVRMGSLKVAMQKSVITVECIQPSYNKVRKTQILWP